VSTPLLRESYQDGVLTLTLARPDKKNALNAELIAGLQAGIDRAQLEADVRVVLLAADGPDFCAGADLAELLESVQRTEPENEAAALALGRIFEGFRALPQPVIAAVRGRALAGGMGLATAADLVIATDDATFGYPEIQRGFVPAMVMTMLRRLVGERVAFELVGTGRVIGAPEAHRLGLITRAVPVADFEDDVRRLAGTLASRPATALSLTKRLLYELDGKNFREGIALGARVNAHARTTPEFAAAIAGFLSKTAAGP
jgi:methylglutaconyl-CoA hydratase